MASLAVVVTEGAVTLLPLPLAVATAMMGAAVSTPRKAESTADRR